MRTSFKILTLLFVFSGSSCYVEEAAFPFFDQQGIQHALIFENETHRRIYRLKKTLTIDEDNLAFYITYQSELGKSLKLFTKSGEPELISLLPPCDCDIPYRRLIPLTLGDTVLGFACEPNLDGIKLLEAGLTETLRGFERSPGCITIGSGITGLNLRGESLDIGFSPEMFGSGGLDRIWQISLDFTLYRVYSGAEFRQIEQNTLPVMKSGMILSLAGENSKNRFRFESFLGLKKVNLYPGIIPFNPEILSVNAESYESLFRADRVEISYPDILDPLPADPGTILSYSMDVWRREAMELFSWNRLPEVLIFDTLNYQVQDRFFKRLAFFVEKKGYAGRLVHSEQVRHLHGYNAYDYRALDLARFFSRAHEEDFVLNSEEELLKKISIHYGIIRRISSTYLPGKGSVLSISRSSSLVLRQHLLTHECFHGIFFTFPDYRRACFQVWNELSEEERAFWKLFLDWMGYDISDEYLVVNEFQAYIFQQEREYLDYYFKELTAGRLIKSCPEREDQIRNFIKSFPDSFENAYDKLAESLWSAGRFKGGRIIELEKIQ